MATGTFCDHAVCEVVPAEVADRATLLWLATATRRWISTRVRLALREARSSKS